MESFTNEEQIKTVKYLCETDNVQEFLKVPKEFITKHGEYLFKYSCLHGKFNIVKIILDEYNPKIYCNIDIACVSGNSDLVEFLLEYYHGQYTAAIYEACHNTDINYIEKLVLCKTTSLTNAMSQAALNGHVVIVRLLMNWTISD